jgi:hypothetical protein
MGDRSGHGAAAQRVYSPPRTWSACRPFGSALASQWAGPHHLF